jgi:2-polyprenyl-3-methyl-5-hydroxy-6-metoxy-1,4-benzoquinol methylase
VAAVMGENQIRRLDSCSLCGSSSYDVLWTLGSDPFPLVAVICGRCGLIRLTSTLSDAAAAEFYSGDAWRREIYGQDTTTDLLKEIFEQQTRRAVPALEFIEQTSGSLKGKQALDIGCATGGFVHALRKRGADGYGIEPSVPQSQFGIEHYGLPIECAPLEHHDASARYDLILCIRTLNHVAHPLDTLGQIRDLLHPGGWLYLEVLNFPHALRRKPLDKCIKMDHPHMFSVRTLRALLLKAGFRILAHEDDLTGVHDFHSLNHIHVLAQPGESTEKVAFSRLAVLEAQLECVTAATQFIQSGFLGQL